MTVQETILSFPGLADFPEAYLSLLLAGRSLNGAAELNTVDAKTVNLTIADALSAAVNLPDFTENKLSISYPRSYFEKTAARLYKENGEPEKANTITNRISVPRGKASDIW
ncbi:DUF6706 family protein [Proteiniphilum acetatigenes]|uniref:DUF6706 family protein n=1 Tax=Proteiniphilum acetatigenes TaxID=294710 RepID=UPI00036FB05D|nr:DUF6706 family protein [Proteiniphilum acetatigenes]